MSREVQDGGSVVVEYKQRSASKYREFTLVKRFGFKVLHEIPSNYYQEIYEVL